MCELQFFKRIDNKNLSYKDTMNFIKFMALGDVGNPHAFGFCNSKKVFKKDGRFSYLKIDKQLITSDKFVIGHNRFATTNFVPAIEEEINTKSEQNVQDGNFLANNPFFCNDSFNSCWNLPFLVQAIFKRDKTQIEEEVKDNNKSKKVIKKVVSNNIQNHPFKIKDFVLVHNGIIFNYYDLKIKYGLKSNINTDSYIILFLIEKFFRENKIGSRRERIIKSIQRTTKLINGSYSVLFLDNVSKDIFYFKNYLTTFAFKIFDKNILVGTTNKNNFKYVFNLKKDNWVFKWFKRKHDFVSKLFIPKSDVIYLIGNKEKEVIKEIARFNNVLKKRNKIESKGGKRKWAF